MCLICRSNQLFFVFINLVTHSQPKWWNMMDGLFSFFFLSLLFYFKYRTSCLVCVILFHSNSSSSFFDYYFWRWLHFLLFSCDTWRPKKYSAHLISPPSLVGKLFDPELIRFCRLPVTGQHFSLVAWMGQTRGVEKGRIVCSIVPLWRFLLHFLPFILFQSAAGRCVCDSK